MLLAYDTGIYSNTIKHEVNLYYDPFFPLFNPDL